MTDTANNTEKKKKGFAAMSPEMRRELARKGGKAVSENKDHMRKIGRLGGLVTSRDREHMSRIARNARNDNK